MNAPAIAEAANLPPAQVAKISQAAQDFESMTIGELLKPMFDTVDAAHGAFGGGDAEATWKPMLVDAVARQIGRHGGIGLAAPVFAEMLRRQEAQGAGNPKRLKENPR